MFDIQLNKNVGKVDRWIRLALTVILLYLGIAVLKGSVPGIALIVVGAILAFTAGFGACPLYALIGINTCKQGIREVH
jgi:hypothetical protein